MPLDDTNLICRYYLDEAASGTTPTVAEDVAASPIDLDIDYGAGTTDLEYTEVSGNRGLEFKDTGGDQRADKDIASGDKIYDNIHGQQVLTFEIVVDVQTAIDAGSRIAAINGRGGDNPHAGLFRIAADTDWLIGFNEGIFSTRPTYDLGTPGRAVIHIVYDTTEATDSDRIRVYLDGVEQANTNGSVTWPSLNATFDLTTAATNAQLTLGNRESSGSWARSFTGVLYYVGLYAAAFDQTRIDDHVTVLSADDDEPAAGGGVSNPWYAYAQQ